MNEFLEFLFLLQNKVFLVLDDIVLLNGQVHVHVDLIPFIHSTFVEKFLLQLFRQLSWRQVLIFDQLQNSVVENAFEKQQMSFMWIGL